MVPGWSSGTGRERGCQMMSQSKTGQASSRLAGSLSSACHGHAMRQRDVIKSGLVREASSLLTL
eukprot:2840169-Amphidinium_carterae.1